VFAGILAQKRRENQVSRTKKQGKQHKADEKHVLSGQFHKFILLKK
jgi:hypothetical protein